jgi:hypothetical protein
MLSKSINLCLTIQELFIVILLNFSKSLLDSDFPKV